MVVTMNIPRLRRTSIWAARRYAPKSERASRGVRVWPWRRKDLVLRGKQQEETRGGTLGDLERG